MLSLPIWKMMDFDSWDDDIPNWMESQKIPWFQTTNRDNYGKISIGIEPTQIGTTVSNEENNGSEHQELHHDQDMSTSTRLFW